MAFNLLKVKFNLLILKKNSKLSATFMKLKREVVVSKMEIPTPHGKI